MQTYVDFLSAIDHAWLIKFIEHRIADQRVIRRVRKWLKSRRAGGWDGNTGRRKEHHRGGATSACSANIFLHYVFDLWADKWREQAGRGDVIIVRYADDIVVGFHCRTDAEQFQQEMKERLRRFKLDLRLPEKTRLIEFGRFAADNREERGDGKPETFNFLGFTHMCGKTTT